jgi:hypothetical protein
MVDWGQRGWLGLCVEFAQFIMFKAFEGVLPDFAGYLPPDFSLPEGMWIFIHLQFVTMTMNG